MDAKEILEVIQMVNPSIQEDTDLIESGNYNSIEIVTMVVMLEDAFDIRVSPFDINAGHFGSVPAIVEFVNWCVEHKDTYQADFEQPGSMVTQARYERPINYEYPADAGNVLEFLERAAASVPTKVAMYDPYGNELTFAQLLYESQAVGTYIQKKYKCKHQPFIVLERRNVKSLIMFLGVVWSGNYYVALDESFEEERLRMMIDIVKPKGLLWHYNQMRELPKDLAVDLYGDMVMMEPNRDLMREIRDSYQYTDPLYGVFTSGTTGVPKCIIKSHGAMVDFIRNYVELFQFDHTDVLGSKLSLMFDAITKDMYTTLYCGASLHIMARGSSLPPDDAAYINRYKITSVVWSPSLLISFAQLHILDHVSLRSLRRVLFVGEALPARYMNYWISHIPGILYVNLYGTSEMTGNCLYKIVDKPVELDVVPLDSIFPGYDVFLLDDDDVEVKGAGAVGEICAGGPLLCIDQLGKPLDPEKFTPNPLPEPKSDRIYRAGDIVRISEDGSYIFLSRKDYRFKHAGYRIDPGEIEEVFMQPEYIYQPVCLYDALNMRIVLFWEGDQTCERELYQFANTHLPPHMLPGKYVYVEAFPLNNSGKVDKARLMRWIEQTQGTCDLPVAD